MQQLSELFVFDRGHGRTVLYVHGQPGLGSDFDPVAQLLVDDHRVVAPDRPGYGGSGATALSMAENASLFSQLLRDRSFAPATLVGHSYGGGVAILIAAAHPELVSGLVLVGPVGRAESLNAFDHVLAAPFLGETVSAAGLFALGRVLPHLQGLATLAPRDAMERLRVSLPDLDYLEVAAKPGRHIWRSFVFEQRALLREIGSVEAALGSIEVPTVVIAGAWDVVVPPSVAACIAASIPGAELVTVDRVGHFVPRDAPKVIASAVRRLEAQITEVE